MLLFLDDENDGDNNDNENKKMDKNLWLFFITLHLVIFELLEVFDVF